MVYGWAMAAAVFAQPQPDAGEQATMLAAVRDQALAYTKNLPDFICKQVTNREMMAAAQELIGIRESGRRNGGPSGIGSGPARWQHVDTIEEQLTYFGRQESYKLEKINGKRAASGQPRAPGLSSNGEFGSTLDGVFEPVTQAEFSFKRWETLRGRAVAVFSYRVPAARSLADLSAGAAHVVVGYHGLVYADRETNAVLRLTTEAEPPADFPLQGVTHVLDYGAVTISEKQFVLPLRGEMQSRVSEDFARSGRQDPSGRGRQLLMRNTIDFREYRKYTAESELKLDPN